MVCDDFTSNKTCFGKQSKNELIRKVCLGYSKPFIFFIYHLTTKIFSRRVAP